MTETRIVQQDIGVAISAIGRPDVQMMIKRLAEFGLAVSVPHMHDAKGRMVPLPDQMVSLEDNLRVTFKNVHDVDLNFGVPVMWRWDQRLGKAVVAAKCGLECRV